MSEEEMMPCPTQGCDGIATVEVEYDYDAGGNVVSPMPRILRTYSCTNPNHRLA